MTGCYIISNIAAANAWLHFCSDDRLSFQRIKKTKTNKNHDNDLIASLRCDDSSWIQAYKSHFHSLSEGMKIHRQLGQTVLCIDGYSVGVIPISGHFLNRGCQKLYTINIPLCAKVHIAAIKAQCPLNQGGDSSTGMLSHQLVFAESLSDVSLLRMT